MEKKNAKKTALMAVFLALNEEAGLTAILAVPGSGIGLFPSVQANVVVIGHLETSLEQCR